MNQRLLFVEELSLCCNVVKNLVSYPIYEGFILLELTCHKWCTSLGKNVKNMCRQRKDLLICTVISGHLYDFLNLNP